MLLPEHGDELDFSKYFDDRHAIPESAKKKLSVYEIVRFDVDGHVFCYALNVRPTESGLMHKLLYFDEDGDGKFEVLKEGDRYKEAYAPSIPKWVREKAMSQESPPQL
jgi:hypothetical protein